MPSVFLAVRGPGCSPSGEQRRCLVVDGHGFAEQPPCLQSAAAMHDDGRLFSEPHDEALRGVDVGGQCVSAAVAGAGDVDVQPQAGQGGAVGVTSTAVWQAFSSGGDAVPHVACGGAFNGPFGDLGVVVNGEPVDVPGAVGAVEAEQGQPSVVEFAVQQVEPRFDGVRVDVGRGVGRGGHYVILRMRRCWASHRAARGSGRRSMTSPAMAMARSGVRMIAGTAVFTTRSMRYGSWRLTVMTGPRC